MNVKLTKPEAYFVNDLRQFADFLNCFQRIMVQARQLWQEHEAELLKKPSSARNDLTMGVVGEINRKIVAMEPIPYVRHDTTTVIERFKIYTNELFLLEQIQLVDLFRFVASVYAPNTDIVRVNMLIVNYVDLGTGAVNFNKDFINEFRQLIYSIGVSAHKDILRSLPRPTPVKQYQGNMVETVAIADEKEV
jgi:hypothetical protein